MAGGIGIVIVLGIFPVLALMGMGVVAVALSGLLQWDNDTENADSELIDTNY